jgi:hypothetical protein
LNVLRELLLDETGVSVSETTMWRQLERMGSTLKKDCPRVRSKPTGCDRCARKLQSADAALGVPSTGLH